jgi:cobyrinic acid a,c-diamide synthase
MHEQATRCPALLISAPASGQGKTTVTAALARLHARQGRKVRVFKCGPDFLDPYWHELASGSPVHSVDLWMTGEADVRQRLHEAAQEADLILVEGVMGLFDGNFSAGDLAQLLGLPVLAVVDASAMAGTFGALAYGLQHYQAGLRWAGMLANRVATAHHADLLRQGLRDQSVARGHARGATGRCGSQGQVCGAAAGAPPGPDRRPRAWRCLQRLDAAADALAQTPLGQGPGARTTASPAGRTGAWTLPRQTFARISLAGALAERTSHCHCARCGVFLYLSRQSGLSACHGGRAVLFSPLAGDALPPCDAIWLPGGYPELHARALHENRQLRDGIAEHMAQGKPVWAECGGMLALCDGVTALDGSTQSMWGLLPGQVVMQSRLGGLGMQQLALDAGLLRGHTFHYTRLETAMPVLTRSSRPGAAVQADRGEALYQHGSVRASYFHAWFPSCPSAVAALFGATIEG